MSQKCPKCKKGYLELDLNEEECYCDSCEAVFEAKLLNQEDD